MSDEEEIKWVQLTLDFSDEEEARLTELAQAEGLSLKCFCIHVLFRHMINEDSGVDKELWERQLPLTLRRNGCDAGHSLPSAPPSGSTEG